MSKIENIVDVNEFKEITLNLSQQCLNNPNCAGMTLFARRENVDLFRTDFIVFDDPTTPIIGLQKAFTKYSNIDFIYLINIVSDIYKVFCKKADLELIEHSQHDDVVYVNFQLYGIWNFYISGLTIEEITILMEMLDKINKELRGQTL